MLCSVKYSEISRLSSQSGDVSKDVDIKGLKREKNAQFHLETEVFINRWSCFCFLFFLSIQVLAGITSEENPFPSVQFHICTDV